MSFSSSTVERAYRILTSEDDGRVCKDIPESACHDQPKNFFIHVFSLLLTKAADGFINPKLILSWILTVGGAPAYFAGLLVPVREAGALLPQLFIAGSVRSLALRKYAWALGSLAQGVCAMGMAVSAWLLDGVALGVAIVGLLAILAIARSVCSVSYKDVLGKTVSKSKRGTATGTASSLAAGLIILYAVAISIELFDKSSLVVVGLLLAGLCWLGASGLFLGLSEEKGATEGGGNPLTVAIKNFHSLWSDRQLRLFIITRALLTATALAPPFMVALSVSTAQTGFEGLGGLLLASSLATLCSSYIWGRLADRSSRKVLILSGACAGLALALTVAGAYLKFITLPWVLPALLFGLMVSYEGVRLGRATHLVDMASADQRAVYTALSNTIIGVLLLAGGGFSIIAGVYGETAVLLLFAVMSLLSMVFACRLDEVQMTSGT